MRQNLTSEFQRIQGPVDNQIHYNQSCAVFQFVKLYQDIVNYVQLILPEKQKHKDSEELFKVTQHFQNQLKSIKHLEHVCFQEIKFIAQSKLQTIMKVYKDVQIERIQIKRNQIQQEIKQAAQDPPRQDQQQILQEKPLEDYSQTEKMIIELSQILQQFSAKAVEQSQISLSVTEMAQDSVMNVVEANQELKQAIVYQGGSTKWFTTLFVVLTIVLWLWEYLNTITTYSQ